MADFKSKDELVLQLHLAVCLDPVAASYLVSHASAAIGSEIFPSSLSA